MKFTPAYESHPMFNKFNYETLLKSLDSEKINAHLVNNDKMKLILTLLQETDLFKNKDYLSVLREELETFIERHYNFENYILLFEEIAREERRNNRYSCVGRGSAGGVLTYFALGITKIDPIKYKLDFRRDLYREELDIDIDVPNRDAVVNYLVNKYPNKIAKLGLQNRYKIKGAIREVLEDKFDTKIYHEVLNQIKKERPESYYDLFDRDFIIQSLKKSKLSFMERNNALKAFAEEGKARRESIYSPEEFEKIVQDNHFLSNFFRQNYEAYLEVRNKIGTNLDTLQIHAGALIFCDDLDKFNLISIEGEALPVMHEDDYKTIMEDNPKIDILSLTALREINDIVEVDNLDVSILPIENRIGLRYMSETVKDSSKTVIGAFWRDFIYKWCRTGVHFNSLSSLEDVATVSALFRPFPLKKINMDRECKECPEAFKEFFKETKGWVVWQEDLMKLGSAYGIDPLRFLLDITISRGKDLEKYETIFTQEEWGFLVEYSMGAFNRAHALSYAVINAQHIGLISK